MVQNNEKHANLNRLSTKQLEELLRMDMDELALEDENMVFQILEAIEQRENESPADLIPDMDKAWAEFQEYYDIPEGAGVSLFPYRSDSDHNSSDEVNLHLGYFQRNRSLRRWFKQGLAAVIAVGVVFGGMVVAQAAGIDVFGTMGRWTDEVFRFIPLENESEESTGSNMGKVAPDYDALRESLSSVGIDDALIPTWYPEGFTYAEPEIRSSSLYTSVTLEAYGPDDSLLTVEFIKYTSPELVSESSFEKDANDVEYYSNSKQGFYILSNMDSYTAVWSDGIILQQITGTISRDDIKKIIDSIGET